MQSISRNKLVKIFMAAAIVISISTITVLVAKQSENRPANPPSTNDKQNPDETIIDDVNDNDKSAEDSLLIIPDENEKKPVNNIPPTSAICDGELIVAKSFILKTPALVYGTALEAKNKINPANTYAAGEYKIFRCYGGVVNITRTLGYPGGWIDPTNPYYQISSSVPTDEAPDKPVTIDVMSLDNTTVNWSHEYPASFVRDYNGYWNISPSKLYLTFDCGYDYNNLASTIMDILKSKGIKAVFFVTGDFMEDRPDLINRMVAEGHVVGNHSYEHLNQPQNLNISIDTVIADIRAWETKYRSITGANPSTNYFRPPAGAISRRSMALMQQLGYKTLMWGAAYKDWDTSSQPSKEVALDFLRKYTTAGDIVLLHGISQTSTDVLSQYIDEYRRKGFEFSLP